MVFKNVIEFGVIDVCVCVKVDDVLFGIEEGYNVGMWMVGLLLLGNEVGLIFEEY